MAEQRLIDANALLDKQESLYMKGHVLFHGVTAYAIENAPTIDPESLPILQQLRAELARVTAERDKIAQYELDACDEYCFGDSSTGIHECEWLDSNDRCKLKEWAEGRKETDRE